MSHALDDPSDFRIPELQNVDEALRCAICKELFETALIISTCSHSFCALCIRRSLTIEQCCPTCRKEAYESSLKNNYDLDNVIVAWKAARNATMRLGAHDSSEEQSVSIVNVEKITAAANYKKQDKDDKVINLPSSSRSNTDSQSRRSTRLGKEAQERTSQSPPLDKDPVVCCPNCSQEMICSKINQHLDSCLSLPVSIPSPAPLSLPKRNTPQSHAAPRKKLKQEVYGMQKDKDLRRILKELGLPTHGTRKQMIQRHKEYVTLYNSNQDSANPVNTASLIRQLSKWEDLLFSPAKPFAPDLDKHIAKYRDEYDELIASARKRNSSKTVSGPSTPSSSDCTFEHEDLKRKKTEKESTL